MVPARIPAVLGGAIQVLTSVYTWLLLAQWTGLDWTRLYLTRVKWTRLDSTRTDWTRPDQTDWTKLAFSGSD